MLLVVGLGNIGITYRNTFHNMGFAVADKLAELAGAEFKHTVARAKVAMSRDGGLIIAKPTTYMNLSGESVVLLMRKYGVKLNELLVVYDDIDLPRGALRIRDNGSAGTHNGMRDIVNCLKSGDFVRVRVGIGRMDGVELRDYVLSKMKPDDKEAILPTIDKAAGAVYKYWRDGDLEAMKRDNNGKAGAKPKDE